MKPIFYNKLGQPVFDAYKLEVECKCGHWCNSDCPDAVNYKGRYRGLTAHNADWQ